MKPLQGMRVLTLEQFGAGPYGTLFLADLGAEVIKIENPGTGGDAARYVGPHLLGDGDSQYHQSWSMNKRSVALDIKTSEGRRGLEQLVAGAEALVNNLRGDQPGKLGIDYQSLKAINPAIVCLHISAYGRDNERKSWPGFDFLMQAEAGLMSMTGEPDGPPSRIGLSMIDFMTGITGIVGLLSCVMRARATGQGCDVDTCLFDVALHQLSYPAVWYLNGGEMPTRLPRSAHPSLVPVQTYPTKDGWIYVMCMMDKFWEALADKVGRPELKSDPRFGTKAARLENREALSGELDPTLRTRTTEDWLGVLRGAVPVAPVYDVAQAFANPFVDTAGMVNTVAHPLRPDFRVLSNPIKIDGKRPEQRIGPKLGADTAALLGARSEAAE